MIIIQKKRKFPTIKHPFHIHQRTDGSRDKRGSFSADAAGTMNPADWYSAGISRANQSEPFTVGGYLLGRPLKSNKQQVCLVLVLFFSRIAARMTSRSKSEIPSIGLREHEKNLLFFFQTVDCGRMRADTLRNNWMMDDHRWLFWAQDRGRGVHHRLRGLSAAKHTKHEGKGGNACHLYVICFVSLSGRRCGTATDQPLTGAT